MTNYRQAITDGISIIEKAFRRDDITTISRHNLARVILDVYDILTEAVALDWWERDQEAENAQKQAVLDALMETGR